MELSPLEVPEGGKERDTNETERPPRGPLKSQVPVGCAAGGQGHLSMVSSVSPGTGLLKPEPWLTQVIRGRPPRHYQGKEKGKGLVSTLPWQEAHFSFFFSLIQNTYYISETIGAEFTLVNRTLRELIMQRRSQTVNKQSNRLEKRWTIRDVGRARRMIGAPL